MADPKGNPPAQDAVYWLRIGAGVLFIVVAFVSALCVLINNNLTPQQYNVFRIAFAALTAFLVPIFGGGISVKTTGVTAFGGCALWFVFPYLFGEMPARTTATIFLKLETAPLAELVPVEIRYGDDSDSSTSSPNGQVLFRVPSGLEQIDEIVIGDGKTYQPKEPGPYKFAPGKALTIALMQTPREGPNGPPQHPNEDVDIPQLPPKDEVLNYTAPRKPEDVRLEYLNL